jgi:hypothetical protein
MITVKINKIALASLLKEQGKNLTEKQIIALKKVLETNLSRSAMKSVIEHCSNESQDDLVWQSSH